jgi:hypothetical protein
MQVSLIVAQVIAVLLAAGVYFYQRAKWKALLPNQRIGTVLIFLFFMVGIALRFYSPAWVNFGGASLVAWGGLLAAFGKQPLELNGDSTGRTVGPGHREAAATTRTRREALLMRREQTGLALIAVGGVLVAGASLAAAVAPTPAPILVTIPFSVGTS